MLDKGFKLFRIWGIPIYIDFTWLLLFGWALWFLAPIYQVEANASVVLAWAAAGLTALAFFVGVLLHELGHALVARARGLAVDQVRLMFFGGVANIAAGRHTPGMDLLLALVGPTVTLSIGVGFAVIAHYTTPFPVVMVSARFLALANLALGLFNLLPGFPLDGGRALGAILWAVLHDADLAMLWAARVGQWLGMGFVGMGLWLALMRNLGGAVLVAWAGLALHHAARMAHYGARLRRLLGGYVAADLVQPGNTMLSPDLPLDQAASILQGQGAPWYLVGEGSHVVGAVSARLLRRIPKARWSSLRLGEILSLRSDIVPVVLDAPLADAFQRMVRENMAQLPVVGASGLVGLLSRERILTFLRMREDMSVRG